MMTCCLLLLTSYDHTNPPCLLPFENTEKDEEEEEGEKEEEEQRRRGRERIHPPEVDHII